MPSMGLFRSNKGIVWNCPGYEYICPDVLYAGVLCLRVTHNVYLCLHCGITHAIRGPVISYLQAPNRLSSHLD